MAGPATALILVLLDGWEVFLGITGVCSYELCGANTLRSPVYGVARFIGDS